VSSDLLHIGADLVAALDQVLALDDLEVGETAAEQSGCPL